MIDMGMRQQHEVDTADIKTKVQGTPVFGTGLGAALEHAAVHQKTAISGLDQCAGTGDFSGRPHESDKHFQGSLTNSQHEPQGT